MKKPGRAPGELIRAGELDFVAELAAPPKPLTPASQKILNASVEIRQSPDDVEKAFMARELVACTLPHSDPGEVRKWERTNGNLTLVIYGGNERAKAIGYPYGSIPRLLLYWITSEAVRTKKRRLELGKNLASFMYALGLNPNHGGKRGDAQRLKEQMHRLFRATISFEIDHTQNPRRHGFSWLDMQIAPEGELWWDPKQPDQINLWGSWIELGEKFFHAITAAPVPCDLRALKALKQSPLALDLYAWATHKAYIVAKNCKAHSVPWVALQKQFGADYKDPKNFRLKARAALRKIQAVYPGLHLTDTSEMLTVLSSSLPAVLELPPSA